jgi:hypothetical protein
MVGKGNGKQCRDILGALGLNQHVLLPSIEEAEGRLRRFVVLPRFTTHVRHRTKYLDNQLVDGQDFLFTERGKRFGAPAQSLRQFVFLLEGTPVASINEDARQGELSCWIADVFHDHLLASAIRKIEQ